MSGPAAERSREAGPGRTRRAGSGPPLRCRRRHGLRLAIPAVLVLAAAACSGTPPATLGPVDGGLAPCPSTPNCVHTGLRHPPGTEAIRLTEAWEGDPAAALDSIAAVVEGMTRTEVVERGDGYLHAEATSLVFRFVDDVEVLLRDDGEVVVRSASRVGRSDLGVNGRRVEELRERLARAGLIRP